MNMHCLYMVVFAMVCVLLVDLGESKNSKMVANKTTKAKDNVKKQESKDNKPSNALKATEDHADTSSPGKNHAKGTEGSSVEETTDSKANDGHRNTELHKSFDHKAKDKQKNQSKTKEHGDAAGKTVKADKNKVSIAKLSKTKDDKANSDGKASDKKNNLKSKTHKDSSRATKGSKKEESRNKKTAKNDKSNVDEKPGNKTIKASNKTELQGQVPSNCNDIIDQYTNGKILMFEYKIKMKRCMSRKDDSKRTQLPAIPGVVTQPFQSFQPMNAPEQQNQPLLQQNPTANFYPAKDPSQVMGQPQVPTPEQAAVAPNTFNANPGPESFPQTPSFQDANPFAARSDVPNPAPAAAAPAQDTAAQAQGVMDQWQSNSFGANVAKKDQLPDSNAQIAQFMNSQQPATNAQAGEPAQPLMQQRSDIQPQPLQQRSDIQPQSFQQPSDIQPQIPQQRSDIQPQPLQHSSDIQPQPLQQRSDIQPQPLPQQAAFNQYPAGPENNLPL